ncbi:MAG: flagellar motor switch protein FliN [Phycisphaerales bacterium]|nr:flagellar motor switch protein FliN [Phycisphaerales bacterium]
MAEEPNTTPTSETPPNEPSAAAPDSPQPAGNVASTEAASPEQTVEGKAQPAEPAAAQSAATISQEELDALLASAGNAPSPAPKAAANPAAEAPIEETDALAAEMAAAIAEEAAAKAAAQAMPPAKPEPPTVQFHAPELSLGSTGPELATLELLDDVELDVKVELGRADMYIEDILQLGIGSVVSLDKLAGDPVDVFVNERLVARGEVLVLNDSFCVRINEIVSPSAEAEPVR